MTTLSAPSLCGVPKKFVVAHWLRNNALQGWVHPLCVSDFCLTELIATNLYLKLSFKTDDYRLPFYAPYCKQRFVKLHL